MLRLHESADTTFQKSTSDLDLLKTDTQMQAAAVQRAPPGLGQVELSSDGALLEANTLIIQPCKYSAE